MPNSNEIAKLNQLLNDIKVLVGSLSILDKATLNKDQVSLATALDAINFRVREVNKTVSNLPKFMALPIDLLILEVSKPNPDAKVLHTLLDDQLESLRKIALSEILTLSIE
jgi:DNA replication protein DnaD